MLCQKLVFFYIIWGLQIPDIVLIEEVDLHVWVQVDIVSVYMMLHHVLVNPINLRSTNQVFSQAKQPVHPRIFANCSVICIMLNIEACFNGIF